MSRDGFSPTGWGPRHPASGERLLLGRNVYGQPVGLSTAEVLARYEREPGALERLAALPEQPAGKEWGR